MEREDDKAAMAAAIRDGLASIAEAITFGASARGGAPPAKGASDMMVASLTEAVLDHSVVLRRGVESLEELASAINNLAHRIAESSESKRGGRHDQV